MTRYSSRSGVKSDPKSIRCAYRVKNVFADYGGHPDSPALILISTFKFWAVIK